MRRFAHRWNTETPEKDAGRRRALAATVAAALICLASLGLPAAAGAGQRAALRQSTLARPAVAGALDETARACPVAYDLWRAGGVRGLQIRTAPLDDDKAEAAIADAEKRLDAAASAGLLPPGAAAAAREMLAGYALGPDASVAAGEAGAFGAVQLVQGERLLQLTWHTDGAPVALALYAPGAGQGADPAALLAAWQAALGLDALPDWQPAPAAEGTAAAVSASAELGLSVTAEDDWYKLEVIPAEEA